MGTGVAFAVGFGVGFFVGLGVGRVVGLGAPVTVNVRQTVLIFRPDGTTTSVTTAQTLCGPGTLPAAMPRAVALQPVRPSRLKPPPALVPSHSTTTRMSQPSPSFVV